MMTQGPSLLRCYSGLVIHVGTNRRCMNQLSDNFHTVLDDDALV